MQLAVSTKNALQAFLAVFLTLVLQRTLNMDHSYWATLTAFLMITQTFGDSIKRSVERVAMTFFGCIIGTLIYFGIKDSFITFILLMILVTFFINYYYTASYVIAVFFLSLLIVFIFASLGRWDIKILEARILETAIGAGIALLSAAIVFPVSTKKTIMSEFSDFLVQLQKTSDACFTVLFEATDYPPPTPVGKNFNLLQIRVRNLRSENLYCLYNKNDLNQLLAELRALAANITQAYDIAKKNEKPRVVNASQVRVTQNAACIKE